MSHSPRFRTRGIVRAAAPAGAQEKITIGVSLAQDDNPFYIAMLRGIRARAQELGWDVATVRRTRTSSSRSTACRISSRVALKAF